MSNLQKKQAEVADRIERAVGECEERTSVEFVLAFARQSGRYGDVDLRAGLIVAAVTLVVMIVAPFGFAPWALPVDLALTFFLGWLASRKLPPIRRVLCSKRRRVEQARLDAEASVVRQGVFHTRDRTGLLIYVSWFERRVEIIADVGIQAAVPRPAWNLAAAKLRASAFADFPAPFIAALCEMADLLGRHLPPVGDNPNEIPNRPVML